jgi:hypothetical protein
LQTASDQAQSLEFPTPYPHLLIKHKPDSVKVVAPPDDANATPASPKPNLLVSQMNRAAQSESFNKVKLFSAFYLCSIASRSGPSVIPPS